MIDGPAMNRGHFDGLADDGLRRSGAKGKNHPGPNDSELFSQVGRDAGHRFHLRRGAISATFRCRPAFHRVAEVENLLRLNFQRRDRPRKGMTHGEIARIGEWAPVLKRDTPGRFAKNHQPVSRAATRERRKLTPWRKTGTYPAWAGIAPKTSQVFDNGSATR